MVLTSLKRGSAEGALAAGPLGGPGASFAGVRRVWPRSLRVAARACHPKGGIVPLVLTVKTVKRTVTLRPSMALPSVASLALPREALPKAAEGSPHPALQPRLYTATRRVTRTLSPTFVLGICLAV